jgi:GxxExxY protein
MMRDAPEFVSYAAIGCAFRAHNELGPGLDEILYHNLVCRGLGRQRMDFTSKPRYQLWHYGVVADEFEPDVIVLDNLILEFKVLRAEFDREHLCQLICYLKYRGIRVGLLIDFGKESLVLKRLVYDPVTVGLDPALFLADSADVDADPDTVRLLGELLSEILDLHGVGYRQKTYQGLLHAAFHARGISAVDEPVVEIRGVEDGEPLGSMSLPCSVLNSSGAILISALRDKYRATDRARLQTCVKHLGLDWGVAVHFGKRSFDYDFVSKHAP